jgi:hypothetical protein
MRGEKGQAMAMVLFLIMVGGLIVGSLLSYVGTGLLNSRVYDRRTAELYTADAGIEDAVWKITRGEVALCPGDPHYDYTIADVNGRSLDVTITSEYGVGNLTLTYHVVATATGDDGQSQIDAYVVGVSKYGDYTGLLGQVLTSQEEITLMPGSNVTPPEGEEHGPEEYYDDPWPTAAELADFYLGDVAGVEPYASDTIDINGVDQEIGPIYREGELEIANSSNTPATLTLTGTVYITGDTLITPNKEMTLNLNGHTIFVESDSADPQKALWLGGKCTVVGSGIIIAVGDIYFEPNIPVGVTDPVFIMSIDGQTFLQPGGDFYGSVAGSVEVQLQPGSSVSYPQDAEWYETLNFLLGIKTLIFHIASWDVTPLSPE